MKGIYSRLIQRAQMDSEQQINLLNLGVSFWNQWRQSDRHIRPDLSLAIVVSKDLRGIDFSDSNLYDANFTGSNLSEANLSGANLQWADFTEADLTGANLNGAKLQNATMYRTRLTGASLNHADLTKANLVEARLSGADFSNATLTDANMTEADLMAADLSFAVLAGADLSAARLLYTRLEGADLRGCKVYGTAVWDVHLDDDTKQTNLIIDSESRLTVDELEVAQFIYLLLNRKKLRNVLDTLTSKAVLILGRFTPERKLILDAIADELRKHNLLPLIFDFDRPADRDFTETIKILAGLSLFVIADITNPKSSPLELQATVPDYQIPFVLIIQDGEEPFSMFRDLPGKYDWVLNPLKYSNIDNLLQGFKKAIIDRAWKKHCELHKKKVDKIEAQSIDDYLAQAGSQSE